MAKDKHRSLRIVNWKVPEGPNNPNAAVQNNRYVYLKTLLNSSDNSTGRYYGPDAERVGNEAKALLGMAKDPNAEIRSLDKIVANLDFVVKNERNKELNFLKKIKTDLKIEGNMFTNIENFHKDYLELTRLINQAFTENQEWIKKLNDIRRKDYRHISRRTQEFFEYFGEVARDYFLTTFNSKKEVIVRDIQGNLLDPLDVIIMKALGKMLQDDEYNNKLNTILDKETYTEEDAATIQPYLEMVEAIRSPSGLDKIMPDIKQKYLKNVSKEELKSELRKNIKTKYSKSRGLSAASFMKVANVIGYPAESLAVWLQSKLMETISTGKSNAKGDVWSFLGKIFINVDDLKRFYTSKGASGISSDIFGDSMGDKNESEEDYKSRMLLDFHTKFTQELLDRAEMVKNIEDGFLLHTSVKDYQTDTVKGHGFKAGTLKLSDFQSYFYQMMNGAMTGIELGFVIFCLNNLGKETLGSDNIDLWSNFLAAYIGAFAFDDSIALYSQLFSKKLQAKGTHVVHMFFLNATYIPFSFILQKVYDELRLLQSQLGTKTQVESAMRKYVKVTIDSPDNLQAQLDSYGFRIVREPRWYELSAYSLQQTRIKVHFLQDFNTIFEGIKV